VTAGNLVLFEVVCECAFVLVMDKSKVAISYDGLRLLSTKRALRRLTGDFMRLEWQAPFDHWQKHY
jgi:hypothetical protein